VLTLLVSAIATIGIWIKVLRREGSLGFKTLCLVVSAVPVFGPIFYCFIDPPPVLPQAEQGKKIPKGTEVYPSFSPLIRAIRGIFKFRIK
jgi:hypothetical protein